MRVIVAHVLAVVFGLALVTWVLDAAIRNFMLPRASRVALTSWLSRGVGRLCDLAAPRSGPFSRRDTVQAMRPALTLLTFQVAWLFLVFAGFTAMFWGVGADDIDGAIRDSGSALFTLGFATPSGAAPLTLVFAEAVIGLTLLALLVSYLPTIYSSFQRREFMVAKLAVRAGSPPTPWGAIEVSHRTDSMARLDSAAWQEWENWFIDVAETHTSLPILVRYRSPDPANHWVSAARTVLDLAALRLTVVDPAPDDPISVTREQFDAACAYLRAGGVPLVEDLDAAWVDFAGWRVNYDAIIEQAAVSFDAPPNPWDVFLLDR